MDYQYPIDYTWSTEETVQVIHFFQAVEEAYETGIGREQFMAAYRNFKQIVPGKSEEKKLCGEFEELSGYSPYKAVTKAKELPDGGKLRIK
ncbi:hypothetical protein DRW41_02370 [Neobacillus piezotolerans]|uniref:UPF0223 protein DRW41_02370 n=1 Tax=Neobacillus piezotolerans TaxID=2259171 RepID=A0A3D8GW48_9BACI|nr:UPF0223 family protein [Neobacillus piezotolerans]RDU38429.1 hypothetical protein DRW41_02370 [Neobacillus piezotolerans]